MSMTGANKKKTFAYAMLKGHGPHATEAIGRPCEPFRQRIPRGSVTRSIPMMQTVS